MTDLLSGYISDRMSDNDGERFALTSRRQKIDGNGIPREAARTRMNIRGAGRHRTLETYAAWIAGRDGSRKRGLEWWISLVAKSYGNTVGWGVKPPKNGKPHVAILQPEPGKRLRLIVMDDAITSVVVHWHADGIGHGRSLPCAGRENRCPACAQNLPARWKGYLACLNLDTRKGCIVSLTPSALDSCPRVAEVDKSIRGMELHVWRKGQRVNSPMLCSIGNPEHRVIVPIPVIDTREVLLRMWAGDSGSNASTSRRANFDPSEVPNDS